MSSLIRVFISYSHVDEQLKNELRNHLSSLKRQRIISEWHDRVIVAGIDWSQEIDKQLEHSQIILLLVSPDFLASDYCYEIEMNKAIELQSAGQSRVIPIFLRPCDWKGAPFGKFQGLPSNGHPVTSSYWSSHDEAFTQVAYGIRSAIESFQQESKRQEPG